MEYANKNLKIKKMKKVTNIFSSSNDSKNKNNNPLRFKNYKIALPILSNRTNISNNNEEIIISKQAKKDINKLNIRRKLNDLYYLKYLFLVHFFLLFLIHLVHIYRKKMIVWLCQYNQKFDELNYAKRNNLEWEYQRFLHLQNYHYN